MHQEWFDNILDMIPSKLKKFPNCKSIIDELFQEVSIDFDKSMKKSMGKYNHNVCSFIIVEIIFIVDLKYI